MRGNEDTPVKLWQILRSNPDMLRELAEKSIFDGFIMYENNPSDILPNGEENVTLDFTIFKNEQIKAADGRNTSFLNNVGDMRFEQGGTIKN
jgi:hypothetical protein